MKEEPVRHCVDQRPHGYRLQIPQAEFLLWVWLLEELLGDLAKVVDEADGGVFLEWVVDAVDVDVALVEEMVEYVCCVHRSRPLLLVAED